jgi:hypothetical protein
MAGLSIWHLLIILLIIGSPVVMYFIISRGEKGNIKRPLDFFHRSFWTWLVGLIAFFVAGAAGAIDSSSDAVVVGLGLLALVVIVAGWSYLVALGILASRTGGSGFLWAVLAFITSPFGPVVSYLMMRSRAKSVVAKG